LDHRSARNKGDDDEFVWAVVEGNPSSLPDFFRI
jgi:hypothetical protein